MAEWSGFLIALAARAGLPSSSAPAEQLILTSFQAVLLNSLTEAGEKRVSSEDDSLADRLTGVGRELAEQMRREGHSLSVALAAQSRVREELLSLCFRSVAGPQELEAATGEVQRLLDGIYSGMVSEWLRLQSLLHRRRHKQASSFIRQERSRYDLVFRRMNEPAFIVDGELKLVDVNPAFEKFYGLTGRECIGSTCMSIIGHGHSSPCLLHEVIREGGSFNDLEISLELPTASGEGGFGLKTVRMAGTSLGGDGDWAGAIIILQDITEQKRAEEELRRSEQKFRSLVENLPDLIWRADRQGRLLFVSANSARILGLAAEELLDSDRFARIHPEDVDAVREAYSLLWEGGEDYDLQYRFRRGDGAWIWLHDRAGAAEERQGLAFVDGLSWDVTAFKEVEEELEGYRSWLEDLVDERTDELRRINSKLQSEIAERKVIQAELLQMTASLRRSNADLEQFAYVASHDLREPLMLITAFSERLLQHYGGTLDERGHGYVERIIKSAATLRELIEALLQLSRVSTCTTPFEALDLNRLILEILEDLEEPLARSNARVEIGPLPHLHGDPVQIRQLFQNLISNALKYHRPEAPPLIAVEGRLLEGGRCEITVADNGIGMEEKDLERIFEPFVRLHARGAFEGSGMGLATCRRIVARHGGEIKAWSHPGQGAVIVVSLPVRQPNDGHLSV